jgi:site-specific recombinase XerD
VDFSARVFGLGRQEVSGSPAARLLHNDYRDSCNEVVRAKILAYAVSTWQSYASKFKEFKRFCDERKISVIESTAPTVVMFILKMASEGKSVTSVNGYISAIEFVFKWFLICDLQSDTQLKDVKRFVEKSCPRRSNKKHALGVAEIRKMWDTLLSQYGNIENVPDLRLRTFVMTVVQHSSFCRFSDISSLKLNDLVFSMDYYTVNIRCSKTDQAGLGQVAYIPKNDNLYRCPHMLMSLFIHKIHHDPDPDVYLFPPLK